jgi:hypothetical protein
MKALVFFLLGLVPGAALAQEPVVTSLMTKELADIPGKEGAMILVEYPPGDAIPSTVTTLTGSSTCSRAPS